MNPKKAPNQTIDDLDATKTQGRVFRNTQFTAPYVIDDFSYFGLWKSADYVIPVKFNGFLKIKKITTLSACNELTLL